MALWKSTSAAFETRRASENKAVLGGRRALRRAMTLEVYRVPWVAWPHFDFGWLSGRRSLVIKLVHWQAALSSPWLLSIYILRSTVHFVAMNSENTKPRSNFKAHRKGQNGLGGLEGGREGGREGGILKKQSYLYTTSPDGLFVQNCMHNKWITLWRSPDKATCEPATLVIPRCSINCELGTLPSGQVKKISVCWRVFEVMDAIAILNFDLMYYLTGS
jgi:hypothetical protein